MTGELSAAYFDCFAGASGDMIVGALLDLGADFDSLKRGLASLKLDGFELRVERVTRCKLIATKFSVDLARVPQPARTLPDIEALVAGSSLSEKVKARSLAAFRLLAEAEAEVHGTSVDKVHFHEVGGVDSIVDTVGAMLCVESLGLQSIAASPIRLGRGTVKTEHGLLPVPAPATALLVRGVPVFAGDFDGEFLTPTGAAILRVLCGSYGPLPPMRIAAVGCGAGSRDPAGLPNALRIMTGRLEAGRFEAGPSGSAGASDEASRVMVVETNIDDMNPQVCGYVLERALTMGARDAFVTPVQMKKGRPGMLLTVICLPEDLDAMTRLLLTETTTLGVRYYETGRRVLERTVEKVLTRFGEVRVKVARDGERTLHFQPEYDDCVRLATEHHVPLIEVQAAASAAFTALDAGGKKAGDD
jgi:uncharacterized protein (TIGR00299 family) protein